MVHSLVSNFTTNTFQPEANWRKRRSVSFRGPKRVTLGGMWALGDGGKRNPGSGIYVTPAKLAGSSCSACARERRQFHGPLARLWFTLVGAISARDDILRGVGVSSSVQNVVVRVVPCRNRPRSVEIVRFFNRFRLRKNIADVRKTHTK